MKADLKYRINALIMDVIIAAVYALVLALNDLYGWKAAAEKVGLATAEILTGYAEEAERGCMADALRKEVIARGFKKFVVEMKKGT